jgi:hypothetical protein
MLKFQLKSPQKRLVVFETIICSSTSSALANYCMYTTCDTVSTSCDSFAKPGTSL